MFYVQERIEDIIDQQLSPEKERKEGRVPRAVLCFVHESDALRIARHEHAVI